MRRRINIAGLCLFSRRFGAGRLLSVFCLLPAALSSGVLGLADLPRGDACQRVAPLELARSAAYGKHGCRLYSGPYRLFFYFAGRDEPPNVHVEREEMQAKVSLDLVGLRESSGFGRHELVRLRQLAEQYKGSPLRQWNEYFTN